MKGQTYGELFESALKCNTVEEARAWMIREVVDFSLSYGKSEQLAEYIIKTNLGYFAGSYGDFAAKKIHRLFGAVHPIFGTSTFHTDLTPEECFEIGKEMAKKL